MLDRRVLLMLPVAGLAWLAIKPPPAAHAQGNGADPAAARATIEQLAAEAERILRGNSRSLEQREASLRDLLKRSVDIDFIARFSLGRAASRATPAQYEEYRQLYGEFLLRTYSRRLGGYAGETLVILGTRASGDRDVVVQSRIDRPSGAPINLDWRLRHESNAYRIIDIAVENVSMGITQRQEFASVISNSGIAGLIAALRARLDNMPVTAQ